MGSGVAGLFGETPIAPINLFVAAKSAKGFYYVAFRVPGANTGTP
jgi:hypothetical protein